MKKITRTSILAFCFATLGAAFINMTPNSLPTNLFYFGAVPFWSSCPAGGICSYSATNVDFKTYAMSCSGNSVMTVQSSTYGLWDFSESCMSYMQSSCNGNHSCNITFEPSTCGGDPDPMVAKNGSVTVSCSLPPPVAFGSACAAGQVCYYSGASENTVAPISCAGGLINIVSSTYGVGSRAESCNRYMASACNGKSSCAPTFSNTNCGADPDFGYVKSAAAVVSCQQPVASTFGNTCAQGSICSYSGAGENQPAAMSCSTGVIGIVSASYGAGTKNESCANYASSVCNGKSSCTPTFSNVNCGADPDYGTVKSASATFVCNPSPAPASGTTTVMPFGDSNTAGASAESYRETLDNLMKQKGISILYVGDQVDSRDPTYTNNHNEGLSGWSSDAILTGGSNIYPLRTIQYTQPQVILLMIGTNDFFVDHLTPAQAEQSVTNLINDIRQISPNSVIVVSTIFPLLSGPQAGMNPLPIGIAGYPYDQNAIAFNEWLVTTVRARIAQGDPIHVIDNFSNHDPTQTVDGIHATPQGYATLAGVWAPELANTISQIQGRTPASCQSVLAGPELAQQNTNLFSLYFANYNFETINSNQGIFQPMFSAAAVGTAQANYPALLAAVNEATQMAEAGNCTAAQNILNQENNQSMVTTAEVAIGQ